MNCISSVYHQNGGRIIESVWTLDEQAEKVFWNKERELRGGKTEEIIHKYVKKWRKEFQYVLFCCCCFSSSDTIKNDSPQKERNLRCASRLSIPTWFTINGHTHKIYESKKRKKTRWGVVTHRGSSSIQYIIIECSMAKQRTTTNSNWRGWKNKSLKKEEPGEENNNNNNFTYKKQKKRWKKKSLST